MKKINFKLLLGSLIASAFIMTIFNLMTFAICKVPKLLETFNNFFGYNIKGYTFDILSNSILLLAMTIIIYYEMRE